MNIKNRDIEFLTIINVNWGLHSDTAIKNLPAKKKKKKDSACNAGDPVSISGSGRSPGEGNDNPLQYSCLENPMDRGAWVGHSISGHKRVRHDLGTKQQND